MPIAWQKNPSSLSDVKNIVRPPTIAGIGINFQNEDVPKTLLNFTQFEMIHFIFKWKNKTIDKKKLTTESKSLKKRHKPLNRQLIRNLQISPVHQRIFLWSDFYSLLTLATGERKKKNKIPNKTIWFFTKLFRCNYLQNTLEWKTATSDKL